jgi:hypothetical protein
MLPSLSKPVILRQPEEHVRIAQQSQICDETAEEFAAEEGRNLQSCGIPRYRNQVQRSLLNRPETRPL